MHRPSLALLAAALAAGAGPACAVDLVLRGARVETMDPDRPKADAVAIEDGRIVAVGSTDEVDALIDAETRVYDLPAEFMVLPGFIDAHNHLAWSGTELQDVSLFDLTTVEELGESISAAAAALPPDAWLRGGGWDLSAFPGETLTAAMLDEMAGGRPAMMLAADGHSAWVSGAALAQVGIDAGTPDPEGGRIERDAAGAPTGLLRESAVDLVAAALPPYPDAQVDAGLAAALEEAAGFGITTIIDPKAEDWMLDGYARARDAGALTLRVRAAVEIAPDEAVADGVARAQARRDAYPGPEIEVNAVKLYVDGVIEAQTAAMLAPYEGEDFAGDSNFAPEALAAVATAADAAGLQLHAHAIGDRAVRETLDAYAAARAANGARDSRHQIAHLEVIDPADVPRFAELDVIANFQPLWAYPDSYITDLTEPVIGPERSEWLYPIGAVAEAGGRIVGGSDWSVSSMNPLEAIQVGVTRQEPGDPQGRVLTPQHRVDLGTMLRAYTSEAAFAAFSEAEAGSLTPGKRADIVVLDRDLFGLDPEEIATAEVALTLFGGETVYASESLPPATAP